MILMSLSFAKKKFNVISVDVMKVMTGYKFLVVAFFWGLGVVFSITLLYLHREIYFLRTENPKQDKALHLYL